MATGSNLRSKLRPNRCSYIDIDIVILYIDSLWKLVIALSNGNIADADPYNVRFSHNRCIDRQTTVVRRQTDGTSYKIRYLTVGQK